MYCIRPMTQDDISAVCDLGKHNHTLSRYKDLTLDYEGAASFLEYTLTVPKQAQAFVLATERDEVVGVIVCMVVKMPCFKELIASEQFFTLRSDHRGYKQAVMLLRAYKNWAQLMGAKVVNVLADNSEETDKRTALFYKRLGFEPSGLALSLRSV